MITDIMVNVNLRQKQENTKGVSSEVGAVFVAEPTQESQARYGGLHLNDREAETQRPRVWVA